MCRLLIICTDNHVWKITAGKTTLMDIVAISGKYEYLIPCCHIIDKAFDQRLYHFFPCGNARILRIWFNANLGIAARKEQLHGCLNRGLSRQLHDTPVKHGEYTLFPLCAYGKCGPRHKIRIDDFNDPARPLVCRRIRGSLSECCRGKERTQGNRCCPGAALFQKVSSGNIWRLHVQTLPLYRVKFILTISPAW